MFVFSKKPLFKKTKNAKADEASKEKEAEASKNADEEDDFDSYVLTQKIVEDDNDVAKDKNTSQYFEQCSQVLTL